MSARVAPGSWRETGPAAYAFSRVAGRVTGTEPPAVFTVLGRTRGLFWGWLHFAGRLMPGGRLPRRSTELVILRVAALTGSAYEAAQHRRLGRRAGLTADEVDLLAAGPEHPAWGSWSPADRLLLDVVEQLHAHEDLDDATWARLRAAHDERTAIELVLLATHYRMLATTLRVLRLPPDRPRR